MTSQPEKKLTTYPGEHPSGLNDDGELAYVSAEFWLTSGINRRGNDEGFDHLLTFQQGWKACKDFYKINE